MNARVASSAAVSEPAADPTEETMAKSSAIDRFRDAARDLGVDVDVTRYPEGTRTAIDAASAIGCDVAQIVKSLVFDSDRGFVLAMTSGANRVDTDRLGQVLGCAIRRADAEGVRTATGFAIGGTPPFGHATRLTVVLDPDLLTHDIVWAAAGTPDAVFPIDPQRLAAVTGADVVAFTES